MKSLLFLVIFIEGYAVLSTELLAIRQVMPFVGSATDIIAIIIAAVLMPLALGYAAGGNFKPGNGRTIRNHLLFNLCVAALILALGLSHLSQQTFFESLFLYANIKNKQILVALYTLTFIVVPVYLMGKTVPLISNYFHRQHLSTFAGRILFYSTLGSFAGSVICTLLLMPMIGLHNTVVLTIFCLTALVCILSREPFNRYTITAIAALALSILLNSGPIMRQYNIVQDNQYMTIQVFNARNDTQRYMKINGTLASGIFTDPAMTDRSLFPYIDYIEKQYIYSRADSAPPLDILMIGSGGFALGLHDHKNNYTYIDINPKLLAVAETYFLQQKLGANKTFVPEEARAFLATSKKTFDLIILDPYQDPAGIPLGLVTREFFESLNTALKPDGILTGNAYTTSNFSDVFSIRLDNTLRSVFPNLNRQVLTPYQGWQQDTPQYTNVVYTAFKRANNTHGIYTDDLNPSFLDKKKKTNP